MQTTRTITVLWLTLGILFPTNATNPSHFTSFTHIYPSIQCWNERLGQLKKVEDSGYPFVALTFELAEGGIETFNLNLNYARMFDEQRLSEAVGKKFSFEFIPETTNALMDLRRDDQSIIAPSNVNLRAGTKKIQGILSNAENPTMSDSPDNLFVTTAEKRKLSFPYFITPNIVTANGKKVVVFYEERTIKTIMVLKLSDL